MFNFFYTRKDFLKDLQSKSPTVRTLALLDMSHRFPSELNYQFLKDPDDAVRFSFLLRKDVKLTAGQTDMALDDPNFAIRHLIMMKPDFNPTEAQIERGLENPVTRHIWKEYIGYSSYQPT